MITSADSLVTHGHGWGVAFALSISHDVVLPWGPPPFGILNWILKELRDELKDKLVHFAVELGKGNMR